jgi:hypothetical protein
MQENFDLPVNYKGQELFFSARLQQSRYSYRFAVEVYGHEFFYERDDEGNYRALLDPEQMEGNKKIDVELLQAIAEAIEAILK